MASHRVLAAVYAVVFLVIAITLPIDCASAEALSDEEVNGLIVPPYQLGTRIDERQLWQVLKRRRQARRLRVRISAARPDPGLFRTAGQPLDQP